MANIIDAICNITTLTSLELTSLENSKNRANSMGESLEMFVKDLFAGSYNTNSSSKRTKRLAKTFSYLGNQNNPPDAILLNGDAIEIKKIESFGSSLALNSSYPKRQLHSSDPMLSTACRNCEDWTTKDLIYSVGVVRDNHLRALAMVYGDLYCADAETYTKIKRHIKEGVEQIEGIEFAQTRELGRVNRVDPLGITYLRVRGMWGIENPFTLFQDLYEIKEEDCFDLLAVVEENKYLSFDNRYKLESLSKSLKGLSIKDAKVREPNNPALLKNVKLITYSISHEHDAD
ncbi:MAG: NgoPII family restriction endonuclease [Porphyromonas sp.]|uniref:NgoPII family restriction endonuclease n=1 Tax=Porphyromonas sp. TaxID=1924944 RepID=UPI002A749B15|nr:NgoPII family restriction endonuclease [Porphyromonas sp.]MDD6928349.1 NgoPII family restriction endonuclease [Bacteroidales bacterium]MDY3111723.1 NgoPII family restriction endonuclease [Porphyromonas sp.]